MAGMSEPPGWLTPPCMALWCVRYHEEASGTELHVSPSTSSVLQSI